MCCISRLPQVFLGGTYDDRSLMRLVAENPLVRDVGGPSNISTIGAGVVVSQALMAQMASR